MASSFARGGVTASLLRVWISETRGRVLLTGWVVTFVGITGRAVFLRLQMRARRAIKSPEVEVPKGSATSVQHKTPGPIRSVLRLAMPSYRSKTTAWFAVLSLGLCVRLAVSVKVGALRMCLQSRPAVHPVRLVHTVLDRRS